MLDTYLKLDLEDFNNLFEDESELQEIPVDLETFLYDRHYMGGALDGGNMRLSDIQLEIVRYMTQIYKRETLQEIMGVDEGNAYYDKYTKREAVIMVGKGCIVEGEEIYDADSGRWTPVELLADPGKVAALDIANKKCVTDTRTPSWLHGVGECYLVTTKFGHKLKVFSGHKFLSWKIHDIPYKNRYRRLTPEWRQLRDMQVGDRIALARKIYCDNPIERNSNEVELTALLIGDGNIGTSDEKVGFTCGTASPRTSSRYLELLESFGVSANIYRYPEKNKLDITFAKQKLFLESLGLWGKYAHEKRVPKAYFSLPDHQIALFLSRLFDTDGSFYLKKSRYGYTPMVEYTSVSEGLIRDVANLLLRLGVVSNISSKTPSYTYKGEKRSGRVAWRINIANAEIVAKLLPLLDPLDKAADLVRVLDCANMVSASQQKESDCGEIYWDQITSIEPIGEHNYWDLTCNTTHNYVTSGGIVNSNSGKDFCSRLAMCYVVYLIHCLRDPLKYYKKARGTYLDLLNIAVNADQAQNVFFDPLKNLMMASPWFNEVGLEPRRRSFTFHSSPIRIQSGNSEAEAWEGLDLLMVVLDEIAAFKTEAMLKGENKNRLSADNIYEMASKSVASRFPKLGKTICISFPRSRNDFIMKRYMECENEEDVYRLKAATWEVNPTITREDLEPMYKRDPVDSRARYEAEPPTMNSAYFRDPQRVRECFRGDPYLFKAGAGYEEYRVREVKDLWPIDELGRLKDWFQCKDDYTRFIHVDLALKHDNCAVAMVHSPGTRRIETEAGSYEQLPVVKMDLVHWWHAEPGQEVNFSEVREFVKLLCRKFPVGKVTLDQWQCVTGDTLLHTDNGLIKMDELYALEFTDVKTATKDGIAIIDSKHNNGIRPVYELETKLGFRVEATGNHPIWTSTGWKNIQQIEIGEKVALKVPNVWSDTYHCSIEEARALGIMVSEGNFNTDKYNSVCRKAYQDVYYSRRGLARLRELGWIGGSFNEEIPWAIRKSPKDIQVAFLQKLYDGDGSVGIYTTKTGVEAVVSYDTRSEKLAKQLHLMLLNFGIVARFYSDFKDKALRYRVICSGRKALKFINEIGFTASRKIEISNEVKNVVRSDNYRERYVPDKDGFIWLPIKSKTLGEPKQVWDITVPDHSSFIADGFTTHNSIDFIQNLQARGINCEMQGVKKNHYDTLKTCFYDGRFSGYFVEELVENELLKLQLLDNGKVDHQTTSGKDLSDALAGATWQACEYADLNQEIEIDILGTEDESFDQRDYEADIERDYEQSRRNEERAKKTYRFEANSKDDDWIFESI